MHLKQIDLKKKKNINKYRNFSMTVWSTSQSEDIFPKKLAVAQVLSNEYDPT